MTDIPVARDFMATKLTALSPEMSIYEAIDVLLRNRVSGAPVVDADGRLMGVLSEKDCLKIFANAAFHQVAGGVVRDYMSTALHTVGPNDDLFRLAELFLKNVFRRLPVVENGLLVGQVSRRDVLDASRRIWEGEPAKKEWTDSKYLTEEMKAALDGKPKPPD
jgi:CBS domain-containing protein